MSGTFSGVNRLRAALSELSEELGAVSFPFDSDGRGAELADSLRWLIDEYVIKRFADLDGPVVAVLIGSTGAGKSTMLNSLAQARISEPGAVRPTTRAPTVWCHPQHEERFRSGFLTGYSTDPEAQRPLHIVSSDIPLLEHLAVIDAPDFDSVVDVHREVADELLSVADVVLFVTSAQRYADAVPWEFLEKAKARGVPIRYVVNRLPMPSRGRDQATAIVDDFVSRLEDGGLRVKPAEVTRIREQSTDPDHGALDESAVEPIRVYLGQLADPAYRREVIEEAAEGAVAEVIRDAATLAELIDADADEIDRLRRIVTSAYATQRAAIGEGLDAGTLIRSEVVKRWQEFVGTGELLKLIAEGASRMRAWGRRVLGGQAHAEAVVGHEARSELVTAVVRRADLAARTTSVAWEASPAGRAILEPSLWSHDPELESEAEAAVSAWMVSLTDLIREQAEGKQRVAKAASLGVNAVAVALLVTVFVHTGGLTGAEVGVAAGAAAAQQGLLEHLFGSAAAASLAEQARLDLDATLERLLERDAERFHERLDSLARTDVEALRRATAQVHLAARVWHDD